LSPYPTDEQLRQVSDWDDWQDVEGWLALVRSLWWQPQWGWMEGTDDASHRIYSLSTGGWSGNESLIDAMQDNMLWAVVWSASFRGGHYQFCVPASMRRPSDRGEDRGEEAK
jgi:hypothetical protein